MTTKEAAEKACKEPNPIIDGRKANVNLAILGAKPRMSSIQGKGKTFQFSYSIDRHNLRPCANN